MCVCTTGVTGLDEGFEKEKGNATGLDEGLEEDLGIFLFFRSVIIFKPH